MFKKFAAVGIVLALIAGAVWWFASSPTPTPEITPVAQVQETTPAAPAAEAPATPAETAETADYARDMIIGNPEAAVTLIEYGSFTCPHCATFATEVFPRIKADYIDTGKIRFIHREVYFDRYGLWAGMIARCGGEMRYQGLIKEIYANQRDWAGSNDPMVVADNLRRIGRSAGISDEDLNACLENPEMAQALVAAYQQHADADSITATPTFIIDGQKYNNMSYADFAKILDEKLAQ